MRIERERPTTASQQYESAATKSPLESLLKLFSGGLGGPEATTQAMALMLRASRRNPGVVSLSSARPPVHHAFSRARHG